VRQTSQKRFRLLGGRNCERERNQQYYISIKPTLKFKATGNKEQERTVVAYMISYPFEVDWMPLDPEYKATLTPSQLAEKIYLIHDVVVKEGFRSLGIHKHFHRIAVLEAASRKLP
jgi:hypothetical protein